MRSFPSLFRSEWIEGDSDGEGMTHTAAPLRAESDDDESRRTTTAFTHFDLDCLCLSRTRHGVASSRTLESSSESHLESVSRESSLLLCRHTLSLSRTTRQGNAAFKAQDYPLAISHYSTAIQLDPSVSTYPLNRALVHLKLDQFADAERDANTALDLDGGHNVKALFRRGLARKRLGNLARAQKGQFTPLLSSL